MKNCVRKGLKALLLLPLSGALYLLAAWGLAAIPVNPNAETQTGEITLFLTSNGVHADIIVPLKNEVFDWRTILSPEESVSGGENTQYIGIGWGERNFYLHTPHWQDLKISTALQALSGANQTLMHVTYYPFEPAENAQTVKFAVSPAQYARLVAEIEESFAFENGQVVQIQGAHYHDYDAFYAAQGRYHLFKTCNTWLNDTLVKSGLKGVYWTPFASPLLAVYR